MVIKNCPITQSDAAVVNVCVMSTDSNEYKLNHTYHTGIDLQCAGSVYSFKSGTVIQVGKESEGYTVTIQYDANRCFQYKYLTAAYVIVNDVVDEGTKIGRCSHKVHFEYLSDKKSNWAVRIGTRKYYKNDPTSILQNGLDESDYDYVSGLIEISQIQDVSQSTEFPPASAVEELSNNKGDD